MVPGVYALPGMERDERNESGEMTDQPV